MIEPFTREYYDLSTADGRMRAAIEVDQCRSRCRSVEECRRPEHLRNDNKPCPRIEACRGGHTLSHALADVLLELLEAAAFPKRLGTPPKRVHEQLRDELRALAARGKGPVPIDDPALRDRIYRPNRKRKATSGKK